MLKNVPQAYTDAIPGTKAILISVINLDAQANKLQASCAQGEAAPWN